MATEVFFDFCIISACILFSMAVRVSCPILQRFYIPTAVIAGFLGLFLQHFFSVFSKNLSVYPGILIAILFCTMTLSKDGEGISKSDFKRIKESLFVNAAAELSQFGVFIIVGIIILPIIFAGINPAFGLMLPAGFIGGHGTAAAIGSELVKAGWSDSLSIGFTFATVGLLGGIFFGVVLINIGARKGYITSIRKVGDLSDDFRRGLIPEGKRSAFAEETIHPASMDTLTWTLSSILMCVGAAYGINHFLSLLWGFTAPAYGLALLCGFVVSLVFHRIGASSYLDKKLVMHAGSCSADYLIAFGIASVNIQVVLDNLAPILLLVVAGFVFVLLWFVAGRFLFSDYWFERSIFIFGLSTGVFSTGVLLLRIADPRFETGVLIDFGLAWIILSVMDLLLVTFSPVLVSGGLGLGFGGVLCVLAALCVLLARLKCKSGC